MNNTKLKTPQADGSAWGRLNAEIVLWKRIAVGVFAALILSIISAIGSSTPEALVVLKDENSGATQYLHTQRQKVAIDHQILEQFVREFIELRYNWDELDADLIAKQIEPVATAGLIDKTRNWIESLSKGDFKGKRVSQQAVAVHVSVTDTAITAEFEKLLRIDSVPLIMPAHISLEIIKAPKTRWNPVGLRVNGLVENKLE